MPSKYPLTHGLNPRRISIAVIYLFASQTSLLDNDPILWFSMMLMPTGPPAMKLTALADVSGSNEQEKMSIAKFLCVSISSTLLSITSVKHNFT